MRFAGSSRSWFWGPAASDGIPYAQAVGDGRGSSALQACVRWLARTFPEAPLRVQRRGRGGLLVPVDDHPLARLVANPNPAYAGPLLWSATIADWMLCGNAYWYKARNDAGGVAQLWWLPAASVEPKWPEGPDTTTYVSHYEYRPGRDVLRLAPADVVHYRYGLDPDNPRKGLSPVAALLRELFTDEEAAAYTAQLLRNLAVPGAIINYEQGAPTTKEQALQIKADYESSFRGSNRGRVLLLTGKTRIDRMSFSPQELDLKALRRVPEERVTAVLGIPAVVAGLGAGLERSTVAHFKEAREAAYESNVSPTQRLRAAEIQMQLLPDLGDEKTQLVDFDNGLVRVLQDDQDALYRRLDVAVQGGWITVNEAREAVALDPLPDGDVLYVMNTNTPTAPDEIIPPDAPAEVAPPLAEPAPFRALPPPRRHRPAAQKSTRSTHRGIARIRARYLAPMTADVHAHFARQQAALLARLGQDQKEVRRLPDAEEQGLTAILETWYARVLRSVQALAEDEIGSAFDLPNEAARAYLSLAGANVQGITDTTRAALQDALVAGQTAGEGVDQLAARIRDLPAFGQARARMVARTELGYATQYAAVDSYRASGLVTHVDVLDGDQDGPCAAANGARWTLEHARAHPLEHPNCVRAFAPVVGESEAVA